MPSPVRLGLPWVVASMIGLSCAAAISATIPELGVVFFVDRTGVCLYRPRAL